MNGEKKGTKNSQNTLKSFMVKAKAPGPPRFCPEMNAIIRKEIGPIAKVDHVQFAPGLPKTRSGKIMRRILRKIACGEIHTKADYEKLGDITTLLNPEAVDDLVAGCLV